MSGEVASRELGLKRMSGAPKKRRKIASSKEKRRRSRKDDIPEAKSIENLLDLTNLEPSHISPYDDITSSHSEIAEIFSAASRLSNLSEKLSELSNASSRSNESLRLPIVRVRSATNLSAVQEADENYDKPSLKDQKTRGTTSASDKALDIPSCPPAERVNSVRPIELKRRHTSADFTKFVDAGALIFKETCLTAYDFVRYTIRYPTPTSIFMVLAVVYMVAFYLELSAATAMQMAISSVWPFFHVILRIVESLFTGVGHWIAQADDLGQAVYCDMASTWCHKFDLMCDSQCSYTSFAMDRMRTP
ncbi:hypothetical protein L596_022623 [Steinernema carpocapsae]|uniref:Uncharacterized protein n=1 Tax=Steinernema carpocapsae TaxID=34508 RepID=A0A4U5MM97_STECR|nr:hypothetical protein L596_022623 [Steinernema carpocapsae]